VALCFLKHPAKALVHFKKFEKIVKSPLSLARSGYWLGKTYDALKQPTTGKVFYEKAARYPSTFYGQLACHALGRDPFPKLRSTPDVSSQHRQSFEKRDIVQALRLLAPLAKQAERPIARLLCSLAALPLTTPERQLTVELASQIHPYLAVDLSRTLWIKDPTMPLLRVAYPLPPTPPSLTVSERALVLALCYRESRFNHTILGGAGELGLMQLMPETARQLAKNAGVSHTPAKLLDPSYNMQLGALFLKQLKEMFGINLFLITAGYNGGPGSVRKWLRTLGNPTKQIFGTPMGGRDGLINWSEAIPFDGTRDYVQRALEAYTIYAGLLGQNPVHIHKALFNPPPLPSLK
jgi:soluble lytic murein transglycosylase